MNRYLIWMEWPEKCFRVDTEALRYLATLVPKGSEIRRVRSETAFLRELPQATHAIVWHFKAEWFARAPRLKVLATPGAGRELVAKEGPPGVTIHFGGYHGAIISETVVGFIFAWAHGFFRPELQGDRPWRAAWPRALLGDKCSLVAGTHAVIVGYGRIGRTIGAKLEALGVKVSGFGRANLGGLSPVAKTADWLILALPSDTGTDGFLNARLIAKLPKRCVVINVGRGNAVVEADLLAALRTGRLAGAYLDVFSGEPGPLANVTGTVPACGKGTVPTCGKGTVPVDILGTDPEKLPQNLIKTPHSSAFCSQYVKMCFKELKDEGLV